MALDTVSDYVTQSRILLQDQVAPYRYPDADLVAALSMGMMEARKLRPDLFLAASFTPPSFTANDSTAVSMDVQYRVPFVYYICGLAQLRDEENTQDARATVFLNSFIAKLTSAQA